MSLLTLTMALLTGFVLIAPAAMVAVLVSGGGTRRPAPVAPALRTPRAACACGDARCGSSELSPAA